MSATNDSRSTDAARLLPWLESDVEPTDAPRALTAALGVVTVGLVGLSAVTAFQYGTPNVALGFLAAIVAFFGVLGVFEAGRQAGQD